MYLFCFFYILVIRLSVHGIFVDILHKRSILFLFAMKSKFLFDRNNTFCISLFSHKTRWETMCQRFSIIDLDVTRFEACTEKDIIDEFLDNGVSGSPTLLQKCCSQSHIQLWRHIVSLDLEYAFILEDDAKFVKDWRQKLDKINLDENWDAIFLNAFDPVTPMDSWEKISHQCLTGGYIISKKGARRILEMFSSGFYIADWMTEQLQNDKHCYSYFPWLIIQDGNDSTIGGDSDENYRKVLFYLNEIRYSIDNYI